MDIKEWYPAFGSHACLVSPRIQGQKDIFSQLLLAPISVLTKYNKWFLQKSSGYSAVPLMYTCSSQCSTPLGLPTNHGLETTSVGCEKKIRNNNNNK